MEQRFTREELYGRVWSAPMTRLAAELGTTTALLSALLRQAGIPTPSSGHWMKKEYGKTVTQPMLPPPPPGCLDMLTVSPATLAKTPRSHRAVSPMPISSEAAPSSSTTTKIVAPPQPRPTKPTTLTREALYAAAWQTPMSRLAVSYGISGNGLAKICDRAEIPYPPRGYWAKRAAGKAPDQLPLPAGGSSVDQITIHPTPLPESVPAVPPEVRQQIDNAIARAPSISVPTRLIQPHQIIAGWLTDHEERKLRARRERDPLMRNLVDPGEFSAIDRRRHRLLNALFKALESQGGKIRQGDRRELLAEFSGEKIEFHLREKQQQGRRPLTPEELRWRSPGGKDWRQELQPTGRLIFDIKTYLPVGLRRQWIETELHPLEDSLPEIVAAFVAAGPLLLQQRRDREAAERERQLAARKRYEEEQQRKKDTNQWRRFKELAESYQQLSAIREFVTKLQSLDADPDTLVHGRSIADWLSWAESWLYRADPTAGGINGVFQAVGNISEWSYRD